MTKYLTGMNSGARGFLWTLGLHRSSLPEGKDSLGLKSTSSNQ
ncbi:rCG21418 [Rattus norvegicus]|uniref:RCG21418 n=1 Tax=Rattus norvegicus TaxID=10116 RepID=A6J272_RAT|nr:rCG21418 [Rattus norvegicus]